MPTPYTIRHIEVGDLDSYHALTLAVVADGRGVVFSLENVRGGQERDMKRIAESLDPETAGDQEFVVAVVGEKVVGSATVRRLRPDFVRHVGVFSVEVHPEHQRQGIGRALLQACVDWSQSRGIERLELNVREDNDRARALYESENFVMESTRRRFLRLPDGRYVDDLVYVRFL